jgi:hypothetical protein
MARYLLNSAVLQSEGTYEYRLLSEGEARAWIQEPFASRLRYDATADAIRLLLGVRPPVDRTPIMMRPGDEAMVFRLTFNVNNYDKRAMRPETIVHNCEIGLLTRLK